MISKKIGIIAGSLRKDAYTKSIAQAMAGLFPKGWEISMIDIGHLPLFNQDYEEDGQTPDSYAQFRQQVAQQDGFVFVTPEYNRSIPAALKNALDIASRPYGESQWAGKPAAVISATPGRLGGFGASQHLRQVLMFLDMPQVLQPEVYLPGVHDMLDEQGALTNPDIRALLQQLADALVAMLA